MIESREINGERGGCRDDCKRAREHRLTPPFIGRGRCELVTFTGFLPGSLPPSAPAGDLIGERG